MVNQVHTQLETNRCNLSEAILLYRKGSEAYASVHQIILAQDGVPVIGAGTPLSRERLRVWTQALRAEPPLSFIPDTVLARSLDVIIWWIPASIREAYFNINKEHTGDLEILNRKCVRKVPYPPLLLAATHNNLYVYALRSNKRPTPDTVLHRSPILNVYSNAALCWGSIPHPTLNAPDAIAQFENALFDSWSTHPNSEQDKAVQFKGGCPALWDHLAVKNATRFPLNVLRPQNHPVQTRTKRKHPMTLNDLLATLDKA